MSREKNPQIFIAKLPSGIRERDLDHDFKKFGPIKNIQLKRGYAFVEYEDYKDAEDAIKDMDGRRYDGQKIVVQHASKENYDNNNLTILVGRRRDRDRDDRRGGGDRDRDDRRGPRRGGPQNEDICYNCGKQGHW
jgi:RNA recognition motif-containing protein